MTGVLSLGLLLPFGVVPGVDRAVQTIAAAAAPAKHVTLVRDGASTPIETHAVTADDLLREVGVVRTPEDAVSVDPGAPLVDGETVVYRAAVDVTVVIDGQVRAVRSSAATVGEFLAQQNVDYDAHDRVRPSSASALAPAAVVSVKHVEQWTEVAHAPVAPATQKRFAFDLRPGTKKVLDAGAAGVREVRYVITRSADRASTHRITLASRIVRAPRARIVAEGIGEYTALTQLAARGVMATGRYANSALNMVATAYTAACTGCSGITAIGRRAGHGIVAVDPRVIALGTHLYIPGYGHALAGDTGGAIIGNRIDLGFESNAAALRFGRRPITVYVLK